MSEIETQTTMPDVLSERDRRYIDTYTIKTRKGIDDHTKGLPLNVRLRRGLESANRHFTYWLMERLFHNPELTTPIPLSQIKSIFIIPIGPAIGDMIVALPLFHAIKRRNPNCRIGTFISERSKALIRCDTAIDKRYHFKNKDDVFHYPELLRARRDGYEVVINMNLNRMSEFGLIANAISSRGIKVAASHPRNEKYRVLYNNISKFARNSMHLSQLGLELMMEVIDFGDQPIEQWESAPRLVIPDDIRTKVRSQISNELARLGADWYIHFNPQARNPTREWGLENAFEFAKRFSEKYERGAIFFTASPVQRADVESKIKELGLGRVTFFETSYDLLELALVSEYSELIITPDTSAIHFGTLAGKPTLVLWSDPEFLPMEWLPHQVPSLNLAPANRSMRVPTIPVEIVWEAAQQLIDRAWTKSSSSYGLDPEADPLYQAAEAHSQLRELIKRSPLPMVYPKGATTPVPLAEFA